MSTDLRAASTMARGHSTRRPFAKGDPRHNAPACAHRWASRNHQRVCSLDCAQTSVVTACDPREGRISTAYPAAVRRFPTYRPDVMGFRRGALERRPMGWHSMGHHCHGSDLVSTENRLALGHGEIFGSSRRSNREKGLED